MPCCIKHATVARGAPCHMTFRLIVSCSTTSVFGNAMAPGIASTMHCGLGYGNRLAKNPSRQRASWIAKRSKPPSKADPAVTTREKKIDGRKRHVVVDTLGLLWALVVTPASVHDSEGAKKVLNAFRSVVKFPKIIWADAAYRAVVNWAWIRWMWKIAIVIAKKGQKGFQVQPKRWIVERTFGWLNP